MRGGQMGSEYLRRTALDAFDELGLYAVSVFLVLDEALEVLCAREPYLARYGQVRLSTVGVLRGSGFAVIPTLARPHYDVVLPDVTPSTLARLDDCFKPPAPNPARTSK
ncbi:MAG TPA: hypothetical protein VMZ51_02600 [Acidimicrobiales bacterium]|nr:hypothetical protein [Acidimicrobiales bacterium]